jgi:hypothetical protein
VSDERLRALAIEALGEHGDERAREVLRTAVVRLAPGLRPSLAFDALEAVLGVEAQTLGLLRAVPALVDALHAALAIAIATREPREKLVDLSFRWVPSARPQASAYRDAPPLAPEITALSGLIAYLEGAGDHALAALLHDGSAVPDPADRSIDLRLPKPQYDALRASGYAQRRLEAAARDLLWRDDIRIRLHALT